MGCCLSTDEIQDPTETVERRKRDFSVIDAHARKTPKEEDRSVHALAKYLIRPAKDDVEKVRALYTWVCEHISYDVNSYFNGRIAVSDADGVLTSRKAVCEGYATLFLELCVASNIKCKKISGFAKGFGHQLGQDISFCDRTNHAWNVVYVKNRWQFIESTWGSGFLNKNNLFEKRFTDFYFLTDPKDFIVDHFPYIDDNEEESVQWQLLENPVSIKQYSSASKLCHKSLEWKLRFPDTPDEVIECHHNYWFRVQCTIYQLQHASVSLYDSNGHQQNGTAVIIKDSPKSWKVFVRPKKTGKFRLMLFGSITKSKTMPELVEYSLNCIAVANQVYSFPSCDKFFGLSAEGGGFDDKNFPNAYQECKKGELEVNIPTIVKLEAHVVLLDATGRELKHYVEWMTSENNLLVRARFITTGYYRILIMTNSGHGSKLLETANILVLNHLASKDQSPFPKRT